VRSEIWNGTLRGVTLAFALGVGLPLTGCGAAPLGRLELAETDASLAFHLERTSQVHVWAEVEVEVDGWDRDRSVDRFPHIADLVVSVEGPGGSVFQRKCDPFEARVFKWIRNTKDRRSYEGKIERCQFTAEPGDYVLSARLVSRIEHDKLAVAGVTLVPRARAIGE